MKIKLALSLIIIGVAQLTKAQISCDKLLVENQPSPISVDAQNPRFTWVMSSKTRAQEQKAYQIIVSRDPEFKLELWNSGKVKSDSSVLVAYKGQMLESNSSYYWRLKVWDQNGRTTQSNVEHWHTGALKSSFWTATWISTGKTPEDSQQPSPIFRKMFKSQRKVKSAYAYITAHGMYEAKINGQKIGDAYLSPGWTSYNKRLQYQVYDVSRMIAPQMNCIAVTLGSGWYRGGIGFTTNRNVYGKDASLLFQLEIEYEDGSKERVVSDGTWKCSTAEIVHSEIYDGEVVDFRREKKGWDLGGYNDSDWDRVSVQNFSFENLIATRNEPVRKHEVFKPVKFITTPKGEKVIDFGQNLVGWTTFTITGKLGQKIVLSHAEVLDKQGNFYTDNLRAAKSQDVYILDTKKRTPEPHFAWHGFRFLRVEGFLGDLSTLNFEAHALYSDMAKTGTFYTSDSLINQLQHNIEWGQKGNFIDVPTDCPQRDERLGWTGDAQVFARTASFNMNVHSFFAKWLKDLAADQNKQGVVPMIIPNVFGGANGSTGWADAATIIPWTMYKVYGDKRLLEDQYPSMKAWVEFMRSRAKNNLWNNGSHFGDWLFYSLEDDKEGRSAITDKHLIAQCFYAYSTELMINTANVLGYTADAKEYTELLAGIKEAFVNEYMTPNGRLVSGSQTAYVLALHFNMLPAKLVPQAVDRLVQNIESYDNHLTTGFLGTPYLCHVLSQYGRSDVAYKLLLQKTYPSWLYPVTQGATTIWERWNGQRPDSTFENVEMNSFNHYAYGAIGDWMYRTMAGINADEQNPGYHHSIIRPVPGGDFKFVSATLDTYYGKIASAWKIENGELVLEVEVPVNTKSSVYIPAKNPSDISMDGKKMSGVHPVNEEHVVVELGSGKYTFRVPYTAK